MRIRTTSLFAAAALAAGAAPLHAQCGEQHELTPVPSDSDFGEAIDATDDHVVVGVRGYRVHIFDADSFVQLATFLAPAPSSSDFGRELAAHDQRLIVSADSSWSVTPDVGGRAYVYDLSTYMLEASLAPDPVPFQVYSFGRSVEIHGDLAAVSGREDHPADDRGVVWLFDLTPTPTQILRVDGVYDEPEFGEQLALNGDYLCIGGENRITVYDVATLLPLGDVDLTPYAGAFARLAIVKNKIYAGMGGKVWIFDADTQQSIGQLVPSYLPGQNGGYGLDVAASDGPLAGARVAATRANLGSNYVFDASTDTEQGRYISSYSVPDPDGFGTQPRVAVNSTHLFLGEEGTVVVFALDDPCELASFCYGDGALGMPCLCGNESAVGDRTGCRNSTGFGARLSGSGSTELALDDLQLLASGGPPDQPGVFLQGSTAIATTFFDGVFCMGNPTVRLQFAVFDGAGQLSSTTGLAASGGIVAPATTRYYQLWYRDPVVSPCGAGANLTNGVRVDWF
jgi:hypothetical protein